MVKKKNLSVTFEYIKSSDFKVYKVHGGVGGPNAYGELILNLYFERPSIPKRVTHEIDDNGQLNNDPIKVEQIDGAIRDVLFGIAMTPDQAKSIGNWLINNAEKLESQLTKQIEMKHN